MNERVKVFRFWTDYSGIGCDATEDKVSQKMEVAINNWLIECAEKINITRVTHSNSKYQDVTMIFYEVVVARTKSDPPQPITLPNKASKPYTRMPEDDGDFAAL